jgi:hypothetical protein
MRYTSNQARDLRAQLGQRAMASGLTCPECKGGDRKERSATAGREGLVFWAKCWRNKCGASGRFDLIDIGGLPQPADHHGGYVKRYWFNTLPLTDASVAALEARYGLTADSLRRYGLRQVSAGKGWYCPVMGPTGAFRGWVRRWAVPPTNGPKVLGFPSPDHPLTAAWQAWFPPVTPTLADMGQPRVPIVVAVEDVFSAMRLAQAGIPAVSLLGTSLSSAKAAELRRFGPTGGAIVLALDADAYGQAVNQAIRYSVEVRRLATDIKDMTQEQLTTWTNSLYSSLLASGHGMRALSSQGPTS